MPIPPGFKINSAKRKNIKEASIYMLQVTSMPVTKRQVV